MELFRELEYMRRCVIIKLGGRDNARKSWPALGGQPRGEDDPEMV
jgi:hypothetical protein